MIEEIEERLEKLERRLDDAEAQMLSMNVVVRQIVDGKLEPVKDAHALTSIVVNALAIVVIVFALGFGLLQYLVTKPFPLRLIVPPPHSSQLPKEVR